MNGIYMVDTYNAILETLYEFYNIQQHTPTPFLKKADPTTQNIHNDYNPIHSQNNSTSSNTNTPPEKKT
jgi:hypothetical protein